MPCSILVGVSHPNAALPVNGSPLISVERRLSEAVCVNRSGRATCAVTTRRVCMLHETLLAGQDVAQLSSRAPRRCDGVELGLACDAPLAC